MSYVDYAVALDEISKMTKQQCNEFTLLHYVKNGLLDLYVKLNTEFVAIKPAIRCQSSTS